MIKMNNFRGDLSGISAEKTSLVLACGRFLESSSVAVLAEISLRSPRKLFIFTIKSHIFWIIVSKQTNILILKNSSLEEHWLAQCN